MLRTPPRRSRRRGRVSRRSRPGPDSSGRGLLRRSLRRASCRGR